MLLLLCCSESLIICLFLTFLGQDIDVLQTVFRRSGLLQGVVDLARRRQGGNGQEDEDPERNFEDFGKKNSSGLRQSNYGSCGYYVDSPNVKCSIVANYLNYFPT